MHAKETSMRVHPSIASCLTSLLLLVSTAAHANSDVEANEANGLHIGVKAKPIKRPAPRYPGTELAAGRQGWVQLSYVVTPDGEVIDPVVEDSSGSSSFEKQALSAVKRWSYEPATWDGKPVQQCETKVMITFLVEGTDTQVTRKFHSRYKKIAKIIDEGNLDKATELIDSLVADMNLSLAETGWVWTLRARVAGLAGDEGAQLKALRKATANNGRWADAKVYPSLLLVRTALELQDGNLSAALETYEVLLETGFDHPQMEKLKPHVDSVRELVASDKALAVPARIGAKSDCVDCGTNWHYEPLRRRFSLADVKGDLREIEFRCSWQRAVDKADAGMTWEVPEDWGDCSIIVFGEPGTTFSLLELPSA
ncbi:MAG: energy transducer TonB [Woeseia sp.]